MSDWHPGMGLNPANSLAREDLLNRDFSGEYHGPTIDRMAALDDAEVAAFVAWAEELEKSKT